MALAQRAGPVFLSHGIEKEIAMEQKKLPTLFFVYPEDKFSNDVIYQNMERRAIDAKEARIQYENRFLLAWEVELESLKTLWRNKVSIPGFKFRVYAKINDCVQSWKLLGSHKNARVAKARKVLQKIGQRKIDAKRQAPTE